MLAAMYRESISFLEGKGHSSSSVVTPDEETPAQEKMRNINGFLCIAMKLRKG